MKVGICLPTVHPVEVNESMLATAEANQVDSLWAIDHLLGAFHPAVRAMLPLAENGSDADNYVDPFCLIGMLGRRTSIPLGVAVTDGIRRGPADVARSALTLHHVCRGGFHLGIGSGEAMNLAPFGYPADRRAGRTARFLEVLRTLLDTGTMPAGPGRLGLPRESERGPVRLWMAAHGPLTLRLAGRYADGWLPGYVGTPERYGEMRAAVARHAAAAGRAEPEPGLFAFVILSESRDAMRARLESQPLGKLLAIYLPGERWRAHGLRHPAGEESRGYIDVVPHSLDPELLCRLAPGIPFELLEELVYIGSAAEVAQRLSQFADRGCRHVVLYFLTGALIGGRAEVMARMDDLAALRRSLARR